MLRQQHRAGEKLFVDYAGATVPLENPHSGEVRQAQIFVAVLGASSYTYAEATWSQQLPDWLGSHVRAFEFFSGAPEIVVPDNLRAGVSRACRYEPDLNRSYQEMAAHYGVAVVPARPRKPRDKAKAASRRALHFNACSYQSLKSMLASGLDQQPLDESPPERAPVEHPNIRGADYFDPPQLRFGKFSSIPSSSRPPNGGLVRTMSTRSDCE